MGKVPANFLVALHHEKNIYVSDLANLAAELTW